MKCRILIVDDHQAVRHTLRWLLEKQPGFHVVGEAHDGDEVMAAAAELNPDLILMDVQMPRLSGVEATRRIKEQFPNIRIIGVSIHNDRAYARRMIATGAEGYLAKDCAFDELLRAINEVMAGRSYIAPTYGLEPNKLAEE